MNIGFIESRNGEIRDMNKEKVGAPFEYSHSYIHFLAFLKIGFKIAYRTVQASIKIEEMHFTHIRRRILKIKPQLNLDTLALDEDEVLAGRYKSVSGSLFSWVTFFYYEHIRT